MSQNRFSSLTEVMLFLLAGNARLTVVSSKTGARFTFKVRQPKPGGPHFVSVLTGDDNETSYTFLGSLFGDRETTQAPIYRHGRKSPISSTAPSALAFAWLWRQLSSGRFPEECELWHEGRCGRCGRALTVPSSIANGIGPECAEKMS
jgi:hypothetical protein